MQSNYPFKVHHRFSYNKQSWVFFLVWGKHGCLPQLLQLLGKLKLLKVGHLGMKFLRIENIKYFVCNLKFFFSHSSLFQHKGWQAVLHVTFRKPQKRSDKQASTSQPGWQLFAVAELSWEKSNTNCVICIFQKKYTAEQSVYLQSKTWNFSLCS